MSPRTSDELFMTNYRTKKPVLSVYMPVFNAATYVSQAIESILSQTYNNFEFIIIDDCSTDDTYRILKSYARKDPRIRLFKNKINLGVSTTSNIAISLARCKYLARIDADDISLPDRFEKQLKFLKDNQTIVAVGGQCIVIDAENKIIGYKKFPIQSDKLTEMLFWAIPMQQPSMMINRSLLPKNFTWYIKNQTSAEEVNLMFHLLKFGQLANLPDYLIYYRILSTSLSHINPKNTFFLTAQSRFNALNNGFTPSIKAILINTIQLFGVLFLPTKAINSLWNIVRGISQGDSKYQIGNFISIKV